ncbi:ATP-binding protein [Streptomyces fuscichromogenes]|uniref:ATPase AAA n=1 Tax=Streptomyces fuscichromogenes TaxID=1324013 RepID=A0A917UHW6_9ACTN|nr:ATP-binding protein [Streptomyces fuscichromogenes]GGM96435.1 ATPase AAA [Streptomyces fuscichromogenes]
MPTIAPTTDLTGRDLLDRILRRLAEAPHTASDPLANPPWLDEYRAAAHADAPTAQHVRQPPSPHRLDAPDRLLLMAAGLIEEDVRFGALFAHLQDPLPSRRPCVGLLSWLLADDSRPATELTGRVQNLVRRGLLEVDNPADPRSEWVVQVPVPVWDLLRTGRIGPETLPPGLTLRPRSGFPPPEAVVLSAAAAALVPTLPALLRDGSVSALVVRGMAGSGRTTLLGSLAAALDRDLLVYEGRPGDDAWRLFGALASVADVLPVVRCAPGPGETLALPRPPGVDQPFGVVIGRTGGVTGEALDPALTVTLGPCGPADRRRLWNALGVTGAATDLDTIVDRFLLTPGSIHRAAPLAVAGARTAGRTAVTPADVAAATRTLDRQSLEVLARPLDPLPAGDPPVLTPAAAAELRTLVMRCRHRERLTTTAGGGRGGPNRGVRALFGGPSGTGKTLAARHLAATLGLDVFRVDLAAVVNKYIGETERNLDQLLGRAEELDVLLLLDEGDALMTRRTDVASANDRYANLETNFLLQRLETFEGIVVVTTNAGNRIDPAFLRRMDVTVDFVPPDAGLRSRLWSAHLPGEHRVSPAVLADTARRCDLTGGQIRNAALHAVLRGLENGTPVGDEDLIEAVRREYRRTGASCPLPNHVPVRA